MDRGRISFYLLCLAMAFIEVGSGLFQVRLYGQFGSLGAPASYYGLTYAVSVLPALVGPWIGHNLAARFGSFRPLLFIGIFVSCLLSIACMNADRIDLPLLLAAEAGCSLFAAFLAPIFQDAVRRRFEGASEIRTVINIDVFILASSTIIGLGIGSLFYLAVGSLVYTVIVTCGYALSVIIMTVSWLVAPNAFSYGGEQGASDIRSVLSSVRSTPKQRFALFLLPAVALVTAPLLTILPAMTEASGIRSSLLPKSVDIATLMLFFRSFGQMVGPMVTKDWLISLITKNTRVTVIFLISFVFCYGVAFLQKDADVSFVMVFLAHVMTNIVFTVSFFSFQAQFSQNEIGAAAALQSQLMTIILLLSALLAGALIDWGGILPVFCLSAAGLCAYSFIMTRLPRSAEFGQPE